MEQNKSDKSDITPYKQEQFKAFIKTLSKGTVSHWVSIAEALNVDQDTITSWKKLPEAQEAIQTGIDRCLEEMEKAGGKDWRMWHERLKTLGITVTEKHDLTSKGDKLEGGLSADQVEQLLRARANRTDTQRDSD